MTEVDGGSSEKQEDDSSGLVPEADSYEPVGGPPNRARMARQARKKAAGIAARRWSGGVYQPMVLALDAFQTEMSAIRELHEHVTPTLEKWPNEIEQQLNQVLSSCSTEDRKGALGLLVKEVMPELASGTYWFGTERKPEMDEGGGDVTSDKVSEAYETALKELGDQMQLAPQAMFLAYKLATAPRISNLQRSSLLVAAFAALEALISDLILNWYLLHPKELEDQNAFTLSELEGFSSIEDARMATIQQKVTSTMKGFDKWSGWFSSKTTAKVRNLCGDFDQFIEALQRRHVVVHHGGVASREYCMKLKDLNYGRQIPDSGTRLIVDEAYLRAAIDEIEIVGNLVAGTLWRKALPKESDAVIFEMYMRTYDLMLEERWIPVAAICQKVKSKASEDEKHLGLILQVNEWVSRKALGDSGAVEEVRKWQVSTLHPRFQLAHAALLDEHDRTKALAVQCLKAEVVGFGDMVEWPLLREFRDTELWREIESVYGGQLE